MRSWNQQPSRADSSTIPVVWVALALSVVVHVAVIGEWLPRVRNFAPDSNARREASPLAVQLVRPAREPEASGAAPTSTPLLASRDRRPPAPAVRPPSRAPGAPVPVVTPPPIAPSPAPSQVTALAAPPAAPSTVAPIGGDLASYVEARRRARGEPETTTSTADTPAHDAERARRERAATVNLAGSSASPLGGEPRNGGGLFQIKRMGYHDAEFIFFGWNREIERRIPQMIEVRQREHEDIQIAVVRKIIAIIREHEPTDFRWESNRLGRRVVLSARARDNADLENFMMREFFGSVRAPR